MQIRQTATKPDTPFNEAGEESIGYWGRFQGVSATLRKCRVSFTFHFAEQKLDLTSGGDNGLLGGSGGRLPWKNFSSDHLF